MDGLENISDLRTLCLVADIHALASAETFGHLSVGNGRINVYSD
jgi:hypothetical protein